MKEKICYTPLQITTLVILRILIGWHLLYEGFSKLLIQNWSSSSFLKESKWILEGFAGWIISNDNVLKAVDLLNTWGLIAIGLGLILGLFTRIASISGALLLFIYYLNNPPLIGLVYTMPAEGNYLIVNKTLIEAVSLMVLFAFNSGTIFGLDIYLNKLKTRNNK